MEKIFIWLVAKKLPKAKSKSRRVLMERKGG